MAAPPAHVLPMVIGGANTRLVQQRCFNYANDVIMDLDPDDPLILAFQKNRIVNIYDIITMDAAQVDDLLFDELPVAAVAVAAGAAPAQRDVPIPPGAAGRLKCFISMHNLWTFQLGHPVDIELITNDDFNQYRVRMYNPGAPLHFAVPPVPVGMPAMGGGFPHGPAPRATPAELFDRGIKKDKEHYPEFKEEKNWDSFRRSVETTASTHGTLDVLNAAFFPPPCLLYTSPSPRDV
jgi:hypothetical protein